MLDFAAMTPFNPIVNLFGTSPPSTPCSFTAAAATLGDVGRSWPLVRVPPARDRLTTHPD
jgi:hypothetical protein